MSGKKNRFHLALGLSAVCIFAAAPAFPQQAPARTTQGKRRTDAPQTSIPAKTPAGESGSGGGGQKDFFVHAFHAQKLGGLECNICHVAVSEGSVQLKRPGHDQCKVCHADDFDKELKPLVCAQCHNQFPPSGAADLYPFPRYKNTRAVLFQFSHAMHVDKKARINPVTGFRADCTFCHKFEENGVFAKFPSHAECASCHSKAGVKPALNASLDTQGCRGCHTPEEIENPGFTTDRRFIAQHVVSGKYINIKFTHIAHFKAKEAFGIQCTTCHYAVPRSTSLSDLTLPKMLDCVECHDTSKRVQAQFRMSNCSTCHNDTVQGFGSPVNHTRNQKPSFHTESFRIHHEEEASAADAKCFVCHQNVTPSVEAKNQCVSCHLVMRPASHTARWKDDIHGKYAALERTECATCHGADYCSRCHNELPRTHVPLALWRGGSHARQAMLDERSCFTCHTYQNTCAECHTRGLGAASPVRR